VIDIQLSNNIFRTGTFTGTIAIYKKPQLKNKMSVFS